MDISLNKIIWFIVIFNAVYTMVKKQSQGKEVDEFQDAEWRGELDAFEEEIPQAVHEGDLHRWMSHLDTLKDQIEYIEHAFHTFPQHLQLLKKPLFTFFSEKRALVVDLDEATQSLSLIHI